MIKRWYTTVEHIDQETGEVLDLARVQRERWIQKTIEHQIIEHETYIEKRYTKGYEPNGQLQLEFGNGN